MPPLTINTLLSALSKRREAQKIYAQQKREDLADQFSREIEILEAFVPEDAKQLSVPELTELVENVMKDLGLGHGSEAKGGLNQIIKEVKKRAGLRTQSLGKELAESVKKALA